MQMMGKTGPAGNDSRTIAFDSEIPIPAFGPEQLIQVSNFAELVDHLLAADGADCTFRHAPPIPLDMVPSKMNFGNNLFGNGRLSEIYRNTSGMTRGVASSALHTVAISGQSTSLQSSARGFFEPSVRLMRREGRLSRLPTLEPFYEADSNGEVRVGRNRPSLELRDEVAVPVCGVGFHNYGHFLYDGLPAALLYQNIIPKVPWRLVGGHPAEWQRRLLEGLGLFDRYDVVSTPVCFSRVLTSDLLSLHVSYPTRFIRPVFDTLRFLMGEGTERRGRIVFFSRGSDTTRRVLTNRLEVETALAAEGVVIVHPERLTIQDQVALAASSHFIIGEGGAAMANVGFCDPGAAVLEIQHEDVPDGWTRAACRIMGLRWHLYVAQDDHSAMAAHPDPKPQAMFRIDVSSLLEAVRTIKTTL